MCDDVLNEGPPTKKRAVCRKTVEKRIVENDCVLNTTLWLKFETDRRDHVVSLKCTDADNIEEELFLVLHFDPYSQDGKVHICDLFFTARHLSSGTGQGLFDCVKKAVEYMGAADWESKLIGFGCDIDGTNANMADGGLKGFLKEAVLWVTIF